MAVQEKRYTVAEFERLAAGTTVWGVYPDEKQVHIHCPDRGAEVLTSSGDALLPDFTLLLKDIFEA